MSKPFSAEIKGNKRKSRRSNKTIRSINSPKLRIKAHKCKISPTSEPMEAPSKEKTAGLHETRVRQPNFHRKTENSKPISQLEKSKPIRIPKPLLP